MPAGWVILWGGTRGSPEQKTINMTSYKIQSILGLAGVAPRERVRAVRWGKRLEWPMLVLAIWIIVEWYLEAKGMIRPGMEQLTDWVVWGFFIGETALLTYLVRDKWRYLKANWLNLVIIAAGMPILWGGPVHAAGLRTLRLVIAFGLLINISPTLKAVLARNHLGTTLMVSLVVVVIGGTLMAGIDPAIKTPLDGIWWAWVTLSTVGYGDEVPVSQPGRLLGAIMILLGMGLFSLITASFTAFFVAREEEVVEEEIVEQVEEKEADTNARLAQIDARLDRLEKTLESLTIALAEQRHRDRPN